MATSLQLDKVSALAVHGIKEKSMAAGIVALRVLGVAALMLLATECAVSQSNTPAANTPAANTMDSPTWSTDSSASSPSTYQKPSASIPYTAVPYSKSAAPTQLNITSAQTTAPPDPAYGWPTTASGAAMPGSSDALPVNGTTAADGQVVTTPVDPVAPRLQLRRSPYGVSAADGMVVTSVTSPANELPEGTLISASLQQEITSDHNFTGTSFTAAITQPVVKDGRVIIPVNSILRGRVVYANSRNLISGSASIVLRPDEIVVPDGTRFIVHATVVRTDDRTHTRLRGEGNIVNKPSKVKTAVTFGAITGGSAVTGLVLGGPYGMGVGAVVGAGVGTAQWALHKRSEALPVNSQLVFSLSEPMSLDGYQSYSVLRSAPPAATPSATSTYVPPAVATTPY